MHRLAGFLRQKGHVVEEEPRLKSREGVLGIPDLLIQRKGKRANVGVVLDVGIAGTYDTLNNIHNKKAANYTKDPFHPWLSDLIVQTTPGLDSVEHTALIITYHGLIAEKSVTSLQALGVTRPQMRALVAAAIEGSIYIWHHFRTSTAMTWKRRRKRTGAVRREAAGPRP